MRCRIVYAKEDGKDRSDGRTNHHDGHDRPNVLGHEGNSALGNVGATQDEVNDTSVVIFLAEVLLAHNNGEGGDQRRNDASGGNSSHEVGTKVIGVGANASRQSLGKQSSTSNVSSLVNRAAHVKGAHAANSQAKNNRARSREALQEVHHCGVNTSHGARNTEHDETHNEGGAQRIQEDSLKTIEVLRQLGKDLLQQQNYITGDKTTNDTTEEAKAHARATSVNEARVSVNRQAGDSNHTGNKARYQSRTLADGLSNVGREHRNHEVHGNAAHDLEHGSKGVVLLARRIVGVNAPQERNCSKHATSNHEDQHVRHAVHQVLVELVSNGLLLFHNVLSRSRDLRSIALSSKCTVNQGASGLNRESLRNTHGDLRLASKALGLNVLVGSDYNSASRSNLCRRDLVLDSYLAVGLNLDGEPALSGGLLERFLRHEGVRNAGRATGSRKNVIVLSHTSLLL